VLWQDVDIDEAAGLRGSRRFEQQVLAALEDAYDRLDRTLGLRPQRKIEVVLYDPGIFDRQFAGRFRFPAAGFYQGSIRVRSDARFTWQLSRVLHHELVHAALDVVTPAAVYPGWLNEGLAEWFEARSHEKRNLDSRELAILVRAREEGQLFSYQQLAVPSFVRMTPPQATIAYLQSYGLIDSLVRHHGERALREFCRELVRTGNLPRSMKRVYRADLNDLATRFISGLR
jgi:hypothetical protein